MGDIRNETKEKKPKRSTKQIYPIEYVFWAFDPFPYLTYEW